MVHDYNNVTTRGVKVALRKFSKENKVPYFPLSDRCGTAIIMKP